MSETATVLKLHIWAESNTRAAFQTVASLIAPRRRCTGSYPRTCTLASDTHFGRLARRFGVLPPQSWVSAAQVESATQQADGLHRGAAACAPARDSTIRFKSWCVVARGVFHLRVYSFIRRHAPKCRTSSGRPAWGIRNRIPVRACRRRLRVGQYPARHLAVHSEEPASAIPWRTRSDIPRHGVRSRHVQLGWYKNRATTMT